MLLGIVLLYVGAALLVNGIWLIGQSRATTTSVREPILETAGVVGHERELWDQGQPSLHERPSLSPELPETKTHYSFMQGREIAVINIFTGGVGVAVATILVILGALNDDLSSITNAALILLFAFTYLWIAANQFLDAGSHAFGWFCLFVAITAVPTGFTTLADANGNGAAVWLGVDWLIWAVLWFVFFLMLALDRPIARAAGWLTVAVAIGTAWAFGYALLQDWIAF